MSPLRILPICLISLILAAAPLLAGEPVMITPDSPLLEVRGSRYPVRVPEGREFLRFPSELLANPPANLQANPKRARTTTGVRLVLHTAAPRVALRFVHRPTDENRGSTYAIFAGSSLLKEMTFPAATPSYQLEFKNPHPGVASTFEIALPSWSNPILTDILLPEGGELLPVPTARRPVYVALGDSISHGTGQGSAAFRSWPFLLGQRLDYELFNLAVGGAQVSLPIAELLRGWPRVDLVTILIGYNDWNAGTTAPDFRRRIDRLIGTVRQSHPEARIVCLRPLFTLTAVPKRGEATLDSFRRAISDVVAERVAAGDRRLFVVAAEEFTSRNDLPATGDPVHLSVSGAAHLADELAVRITPLLETPSKP